MDKQLFALLEELGELHSEYTSGNKTYVIDITVKPNTDKINFENWSQQLPDDIFAEAVEALGPEKINEYETENYKEVIDLFKSTTKKVIKNKIEEYKALLED